MEVKIMISDIINTNKRALYELSKIGQNEWKRD
jgi:hypothetical protein